VLSAAIQAQASRGKGKGGTPQKSFTKPYSPKYSPGGLTTVSSANSTQLSMNNIKKMIKF
jgi:hypothetical protein